MPSIPAQVWKSTKFDVLPHEEPGMITFRLSGPLTARDMYSFLSPDDLRDILECVPSRAHVHCFDVTAVPYMDSVGMSVILNHETRCRAKGVHVIVVGSCPRVVEALKRAKMEHLYQAAAHV